MSVILKGIYSIKGYSERSCVSRTLVDRWIKKRDKENICLNQKTGKRFKYIEHNYLKLIKEL